MTYQNILFENRDTIAYITINRPSKLNALNKETIAELADVVKKINADTSIRAALITGAGEKAFVAGADISEFSSLDKVAGEQLSALGHEGVFNAIENAPKPYLAAINGFALGGGLELALACHMRIASTTAKLGLPEVTLGLIPGYGGTQRLTQLVGKGLAFEMICSADMIAAERALQIGLINSVCAPEELILVAEQILNKITQRAPLAIKEAIIAINASTDPTKDGFATEINSFGNCFQTQDFKEGVDAFLEKRKPVFKGE
ncbi:MAG: enoyl-CoA hydratase [Pedobacter sp.]|nr:MAG: enoyl-CoA hydratase [Pedobacter sp.]